MRRHLTRKVDIDSRRGTTGAVYHPRLPVGGIAPERGLVLGNDFTEPIDYRLFELGWEVATEAAVRHAQIVSRLGIRIEPTTCPCRAAP